MPRKRQLQCRGELACCRRSKALYLWPIKNNCLPLPDQATYKRGKILKAPQRFGSTYLMMNIRMLNRCQNIKTHKQRGPPPHTHSSRDSFIKGMSQSGRLFYCSPRSAHGRPWTRLSQSRRRNRGRWSPAAVISSWPQMAGEHADQRLCSSSVIGSVLDLNSFNRCMLEPWAMEAATVEERARTPPPTTPCAAVSLFFSCLILSAWFIGSVHMFYTIHQLHVWRKQNETAFGWDGFSSDLHMN